jgi:hypothetical protein
MALTDTRFRDLVDRERDERGFLQTEQKRLTDKTVKLGLSPEEVGELARIDALLALQGPELVDRLYVGVRDAFNSAVAGGLLNKVLLNHKNGVLATAAAAASPYGGVPEAAAAAGASGPAATTNAARSAPAANAAAALGLIDDDDVVRVSHVLGVLASKGVQAARVQKTVAPNAAGSFVAPDTTDPRYEPFVTAFFEAFGQAQGTFKLARLVLPILQVEGDSDGGRLKLDGEVKTSEFALVVSCLRGKRITEDELHLARRINECLDTIQHVKGENAEVADLGISLPDLNEVTAYNIQSENVEAFGPMICAAMFDELKAFEVVDKIAEQWQRGIVPIGFGEAGKKLYEYWKSAPNRMSDGERRNFYALTMGIPGGQANGSTNRDFNDLWLRFVSSVSTLVRQKTADQILRSNLPMSVSQQQVRKAARDLAANLSLHGYGMINYAARDLQKQIKDIISLLDSQEIKQAYGAKDMWQVIDQVAALELGGARNSSRYRTLATCGAIITKWLSQNVRKFNTATTLQKVVEVDQAFLSEPPTAGADATKRPTDYDLINACELWLADTAVSDERIEEVSRQPREAPAMTSRPVQIPSMARELLEQALPAGVGLGMGTVRH